MTHPVIAFIGAGNMASSLIGGLIEQGYPHQNIWASNITQAPLTKLNNQYKINTSLDNAEAVKQAEVIVLSVKPQIMKTVVTELSAVINNSNRHQAPLILSIAAGISAQTLQHWLGAKQPVVRCMPNTPALLQCGASGLYKTAEVSEQQAEQAETLLNAVGITLWVKDEAAIDAVTAVSGSGPAYYFLFMEAMQEAGISLGLDSETAKQLTLQTALGAARMALESSDEPAELRKKVTSPGGTTEQAINTFIEQELGNTVKQAMTAARDRSVELSKSLADK